MENEGRICFQDIDDFRQKLDVPNTYANKRLMEKVIKPSVVEIQRLDKSFENFMCEPLYLHKRGKPLAGYKFTWKPENRQNKLEQQQKQNSSGEKKSVNKSSFQNFTQREYDYQKLEEELLSNQNSGSGDEQEDFEELLKNFRSK